MIVPTSNYFVGKQVGNIILSWMCLEAVTEDQLRWDSNTWNHLNSYLFERKQQPMCFACQTKYILKHILIECTDLVHIRKTFYSANNMKELFQNTEINNVISFLKTVKLYTKS